MNHQNTKNKYYHQVKYKYTNNIKQKPSKTFLKAPFLVLNNIFCLIFSGPTNFLVLYNTFCLKASSLLLLLSSGLRAL